MQVQEIMSRGIDAIDADMTVREAAQRMRETNLGALPVVDSEALIGMVTDRDIVTRGVAADKANGTTLVRSVMSEDLYCCYVDDEVRRAAQIMAEHQVRRVPVLDRDNRPVGMVSLADLARNGDDEATKSALRGVSEPSDAERR